MSRARLRELLRERRPDTLELCRALIAVPSEDPPGDNRPVATYLREFLQAAGVTVHTHAAEEQRPNLVAQVRLGHAGPNLVLNGHMETLPVGDRAQWTHDPFGAEIVGERLYGRGTWCMKGGIAAEIAAALALRECGDGLGGTITLAFVSDEVNGGGRGTGYVLEHVPAVRGDVAVVAEGAPAILIGHKGPVFVEFTATGQAMQSAYIFAAESAIHRMIALLRDVQQLSGQTGNVPDVLRKYIEANRPHMDAEFGPGATDALLSLTVNVGTIAGGRRVNVIADRCEARVDFRLPVGVTVEQLTAQIDAIVRKHPGTSARVLWANPPAHSSPEHPWLQMLQRVSAEVLHQPYRFRVSHGFTDARFFHLRGIPAAAIGRPGGIAGAPDEYIELEGLYRSAELMALAAWDYLHAPPPR